MVREGGEQKEPSAMVGKAPLDRLAMGKLMGQRNLPKGLVDGGRGEKREFEQLLGSLLDDRGGKGGVENMEDTSGGT